MARNESKEIMGYLPIEARHHDAITSLITPATPATRLLDPFAGDGAFLEVAAKAWNVTPYANELDKARADACVQRFGPKQAVRGDAERLRASNNAFGIAWINPPYDHDRAAVHGNKRVELAMLRHSWKWVQKRGIVLWCVYRQHVTEEAMAFISANSSDADLWALPGKHQGEYDQIVLVAIKGQPRSEIGIYNKLMEEKQVPVPLTPQAEPIYKVPAPLAKTQRFYFAPDDIDDETGLKLIQKYGAWGSQGFQELLAVPQPPAQEEPLVTPRPGHMALVLSSGFANGAVLDTTAYGRVALRSKIEVEEVIARVDTETDPKDPERTIKKTTMRLRPTTKMTLLGEDGTLVEMEGDDALLGFIKANRRELAQHMNERFDPLYKFDFAGIRRYLDRIRLKGKYELYTPQKHVVAATVSGFRKLKGQLLIGQMGVGKTALGGSTAIAIAGQIVEQLQGDIRDDQVVLIVCPPHLVEKWERELYSIRENIYIKRLNRHEDIKGFMEKAARLGPGIPKIGLVKRDMTKLGSGYEPAVNWRKVGKALWRHDQPTPDGYTEDDRISFTKIPQCPCCGQTITYERKGTVVIASQKWLKDGKRTCDSCHTPLWQEKRDKGSKPKPGHKYPHKNPRYRIDEYIKRRYPDRIYLLVWDEIHEAANGDTGNGEAFGRLANVSRKVLGLTGTPFNGRASSMFNIEYHVNPRTRQAYPWGGSRRLSRKTAGAQTILETSSNQRGRAESRWVEDMGVREQVLEERPQYDDVTGAYTGTSSYQRPYQEAPGCSPKLIAWLLPHSIFFSLKDLGKHLPKYTEIAHPVPMDDDVAAEYDRTRDRLKDYLVQRRWEGDTTFRGSYLQWSMGWVNATFRPMDVIHNIRHPITNEKRPHVVTRLPSFGEDRLYAKEEALVELVTDRLNQHRPVVIYARQTATKDIQPRIEKIIQENVPGAVTYVLKNTVAADRRERVIEQQIQAGVNVLICNPELVKTGLDLINFPTLIFYEIVFNLSTLLQAASRSYRLNQERDECEV
ncbi:MAG: helicase-related protein, partial [Chloroflexota bacterium]